MLIIQSYRNLRFARWYLPDLAGGCVNLPYLPVSSE